MEKYKICPNPKCGKHNKSTAIECIWCEADISRVKPTDDETEAARAKTGKSGDNTKDNSSSQSSSGNKMIRICESCGTHNLPNARKCESCGEDISDITPVNESSASNTEETASNNSYSLVSLDGLYSFCISDGIITIGREAEMKEYLSQKPFVSRSHAEISFIDGKLMIRNLSNTNFTYINNVKLTNDNPIELKENDEIGLGGNINGGQRQDQAAYFMVKING